MISWRCRFRKRVSSSLLEAASWNSGLQRWSHVIALQLRLIGIFGKLLFHLLVLGGHFDKTLVADRVATLNKDQRAPLFAAIERLQAAFTVHLFLLSDLFLSQQRFTLTYLLLADLFQHKPI